MRGDRLLAAYQDQAAILALAEKTQRRWHHHPGTMIAPHGIQRKGLWNSQIGVS
jgi:hypothetical protein